MKAAEKYDLLVLLLPGWNPAHNSEVQSKDEMEGLPMGFHWGPRTENKLNWSALHCVPYLVTYRDLSPRAILVFISSPWPGKAREGNLDQKGRRGDPQAGCPVRDVFCLY
ncbi:uncharacterized protein APUU_20820S [Aspergillus puulaauensis]|uniref:Uncharacterized protein n=1 Tax=Aspergillus puulaauensis TaxID=1220207 RepID=A0A7R7XG86_9EURO|nr:uncharacterized protein APUU_20820S [Aspergillus puulaauensis]BCS20388.1 hypothetical protein APUU_20820S [Aspergillus puulaauensis]